MGRAESSPVVAFLGAGLMGRPMVERLLGAGHEVLVWNRSRDRLAPLLALGARALEAPRDAASGADLVLACLMDTAAVERCVFGDDGIASVAAPRASVFVDHSSIRPDATRAMATRLEAANGIDWVDAPVSGGVAGARDGTLAVMCGGSERACALAGPVLRAYAGAVTRMGPSGAGQTTKLVNQMLVASAIATLAEAVSLARTAGVDAARLPEALAGGWADSKPMRTFVPRMTAPHDAPIGALSTMLKDVDTALDLARGLDAPAPMTALVQQLLRLQVARGHADDDLATLAELYAGGS
jgi:2-hydroxy-3-oxopropionate reductase